MLRQTFGVTWGLGTFREPAHGILKHLAADEFRAGCETAWSALIRDRELLSYSYQYELESQKGVRQGGGQGGGFLVRGLHPSITTKPKGYCTLRLRRLKANGEFAPVEEVIDLRKVKLIQTDDVGYLKVHRRAQAIDWYREMPRILEFAGDPKAEFVEVRLVE